MCGSGDQPEEMETWIEGFIPIVHTLDSMAINSIEQIRWLEASGEVASKVHHDISNILFSVVVVAHYCFW